MSEREIDEAIDRAVRSLMSAEPRGDLRRRVMARLDVPGRSWLTMPRLAAAGLGAAALVTVVFLNRDGVQPVAPVAPAVQQARTPSELVAPPRPTPDSVVAGDPKPPAASRAPSRYGRVPARPAEVHAAAILDDPEEAAIEPLESVEPLALRSIVHAPLVWREITIRELGEVPPMTIPPLPEGGSDTPPRKDR